MRLHTKLFLSVAALFVACAAAGAVSPAYGAIIVVAVCSTYGLVHLFVALPLRHIAANMRKIAESRDAESVATLPDNGRDDDLSQIAASFNRVLESVRVNSQALEQTRQTLEKRVTERTSEIAASNVMLTAMRDSARDGIIMLDHLGRITELNAAAEKMFGWKRNELIGRSLAETIMPAALRGMCTTALEAYLETQQASLLCKHVEMPAIHAKGHRFPIELSINDVCLADRPPLFTAIIRDLTDRKRAQQNERDRVDVLEMVVRDAPLPLIFEKLVRGIQNVRPESKCALLVVENDLLRCAASQLGGDFERDIEQLWLPINALKKFESWRADAAPAPLTVSDTDSPERRLRYVYARHGLSGWWCASITAGESRVVGALIVGHKRPCDPTDEDKQLLEARAGLAGVAIEHQQIKHRLSYQAYHDALTTLPNRALMEDRLAHALQCARRDENSVAVLFADVDKFKVINDTLGHRHGDLMLKEVAKRLLGVSRESDTLARMGGDEFVLISPRISDRHGAARLAERMLEALRAPIELEGHTHHVTSSVGISIFPTDGTDVETLLRSADAAMYRAKSRGRNTFEYFSRELNKGALDRLELEADLRRAVGAFEDAAPSEQIPEFGQFKLEYQPQVDRDGRFAGVEALLRWKHPKRGMIPPMTFIPMAEESGLIVPLGVWALRQACRQAREWRAKHPTPIPIAVNVSARQFAQADFVEMVLKALDEHQLPPGLLEIELTESVLMHNADEVARKLSELRQLNVGVAIDDFGTGYSSLAYLHRLSIDTLKIDRSFVKELQTDPTNGRDAAGHTAVIRAIQSLADSLKLKVVAEGVETPLQAGFLARLGCDLMQGYLFSRPVPPEQIDAMVGQILPMPQTVTQNVA